MKTYQCISQVRATPMSRKDYNDLRGWEVPKDEDPQEAGYLVESLDGSRGNHPNFKGYISWSPKIIFQPGHVEIVEPLL